MVPQFTTGSDLELFIVELLIYLHLIINYG